MLKSSAWHGKRLGRFAALAVCAAAIHIGPVQAQNLVAAGVDCKPDPRLGTLCSVYRDIGGHASARTRNDYSGGTGSVVASSFAYRGGANATSDATLGSSESQGFATFGLLRSFSAASGLTNGEWLGPSAVGVARTRVGFTDSLQITSPGRAGQSGTVRVKVRVDGSLDANSFGATTQSVTGKAFVQFVFGNSAISQQLISEGGTTRLIGDSIVGERVYDIGVTFGDTRWNPFSSYLYTAADGSASNFWQRPAGASGVADFGHTMAWGGLVAVLDSSGQVVNDWTMRSASGFDYSRSFVSQVPEPGSWVLMIGGLFAIGFLARRRSAD